MHLNSFRELSVHFYTLESMVKDEEKLHSTPVMTVLMS